MARMTITLCLIFFNTTVWSQAGLLDSTFNNNGMLGVGISSWEKPTVKSVVFLPPDRILISSSVYDKTPAGPDEWYAALLKYKTDGTKDSSFGLNGVSRIPLTVENEKRTAVYTSAVQQDGKILAGCNTKIGGISRISIVRMDNTGNLDASFAANGEFLISPVPDKNSTISKIVIQPDQKIVGLGKVDIPGLTDFSVLIRLNPDGTPDPAFGVNGIVLDSSGVYNNLNLLADGRILLAGYKSITVLNRDFCAALYLPNGIPDPSYGINGNRSWTEYNNRHEEIEAVVVQPDNKIVLVKNIVILNNTLPPDSSFLVVERWNADFSPDLAFGINGKNINYDCRVPCYLAMQPDGKILMAGNSDVYLTRFMPDGKTDLTFGNKGFNRASFDEFNAPAGLVLDVPQNRFYVGGNASDDIGHGSSFLMRFRLGDLTVGVKDIQTVPVSVELFPNPVNDETTLRFSLPESRRLNIFLSDLNGRVVQQFVHNQSFDAGEHQIKLHISPAIPKGLWLVTVASDDGAVCIKMVR